jgi:hypothetical protein
VQVKLVLQRNRLFVESPDKAILQKLLEDVDIQAAQDACGGSGIKSGHARLDTAAQAITTRMQTIDLTKALEPEEEDGHEGNDGADGTAIEGRAARHERGEADVEAEEAEASMLAAAQQRTATNGSSVVATGKGRRGQAAAAGSTGASGGSHATACEPRPIPFAKQSAIPDGPEQDVEIFSFEISPIHVRPAPE